MMVKAAGWCNHYDGRQLGSIALADAVGFDAVKVACSEVVVKMGRCEVDMG